ncbi:hypothetical protein [Alteromonas antoniana]|uniref:hypothetical protein n=1 Tax=Alteromonas antoniana TaxID=2803813 RepID=UPI001C454E47|nr:hypothetical protein [Alteromonas antoniana]
MKMITKLGILSVILLFMPPTFAEFHSEDSIDEKHREVRTKRYTEDINGDQLQLGFLCKELSPEIKILGITFGSDTYIAPARQSVRLKVKVDDGITYPLYGSMSTMGSMDLDSTNSGWAQQPSMQLLNELRTGDRAQVIVYTDSVEIEGEFSLSGARAAIDDVVAACT